MEKIMKARRSGFTLVELLIVIMIIAILAGMMMLATGSATDSANATKVINDLRNLKSASLMFYGDYRRWPSSSAADIHSVDLYMDRSMLGRYAQILIVSKDGGGSVIGLELSNDLASNAIKTKIAAGAADAGLLKMSSSTPSTYDGSANEVYMNMN
ncbi:MAG: type II secretion system GspH family protein [Synergistaceae bacterium]|nr:type II secretion system GspH family protein [Synergistaceae bacterium]